MRQKDTLIFILLGVGLFIMSALGLYLFLGQSNEPAPEGYKIYKNVFDHYKMIYPEDWKVYNPGSPISIQFLSPDIDLSIKGFPRDAAVTIVIDDLSKAPKQLDEYTDTAIKQVKVVYQSAVEVSETKPTELSGYPAYQFSYVITLPEKGSTKIQNVWTIANNKAYQFTYAAPVEQFDQNKDIIDRVIESFKITK
ncbi:MAG: hypothetical protein HQL25_04750 [Candidatus Omnitrophica bacterium]|nr:hypothetical protein [Candidatus Omnitrophota bacterium]